MKLTTSIHYSPPWQSGNSVDRSPSIVSGYLRALWASPCYKFYEVPTLDASCIQDQVQKNNSILVYKSPQNRIPRYIKQICIAPYTCIVNTRRCFLDKKD